MRIERGLRNIGGDERIQDPAPDRIASRQIDHAYGFIIKGERKQQDLKSGRFNVTVNATLFKIHIAVGLQIDAQGRQGAGASGLFIWA